MLKKVSTCLIKLIISLTVAYSLFTAFTLATYQETGSFYELIDRYNIFVTWEPLYVNPKNAQIANTSTDNYYYTQIAWDKNGHPQDVGYYTPEKLSENHYLKLTAKGRYIQTLEDIAPCDIPFKAWSHLAS